MQVAVLGDIHSNLDALTVVLEDCAKRGIQEVLQVGDVVGYGPDPKLCIAALRERGARICLGNHDAAVLGRLELNLFNPFARFAVEWTRQQLDAEDMAYLRALPFFQVLFDEDITIVHGSLHEPSEFDYVRSLSSARLSMEAQETKACFVGHTHQPCLFTMEGGADFQYRPEFESQGVYRLEACQQGLVNVGSVGQPRDEDPRTGYLVYDTDELTCTLVRLEYPVEVVQAKIRGAGLPEVLADRLTYGL
jgi:diadenosine tetraphosphatase ApaH/serine/threonine PP2A family protein phosphatase